MLFCCFVHDGVFTDGRVRLQTTKITVVVCKRYLHYHPGGIEITKECIGGDATKLFEEYHRWVNVDNLIGKLLIGYLDVNSSSSSNNTKTSVLTTHANGATGVSQFSMAPPRPVVRQPLPSLLNQNNSDHAEQEDNEDLNPWEETLK